MGLGFILLQQCLPGALRLVSLIIIKIKFMPQMWFNKTRLIRDPGRNRGLMSFLHVLLHWFLQYHEHYTCISRAKSCWTMLCHASCSFGEVFPNMLIIVGKRQLMNVLQTWPHPFPWEMGKQFSSSLTTWLSLSLQGQPPVWILFCEWGRSLFLWMSKVAVTYVPRYKLVLIQATGPYWSY